MDGVNNYDKETITGPERRHEEIGPLVERLIERFHYNHTRVDDELSTLIFSNYIDNLDENRSYFTKKEIKEFEIYRYEVDDMLGAESLAPVFQIFNKYKTIAMERMEYALEVLNQKPDFTLVEDFQFNRSEEAWPNSTKELNELWRKRVKNDALSLILNEKDWAESKDILQKRYTRFLKQLKQINNDDIFETFMNSVVRTLDPHSSYLSPRNSEEYQIQMSLSYFGIGATLSIEDDYVSIVNIIPGGPAAIDGQLKPKDRITAIAQGNEGELTDVIGWRLDDVVQLIRGPENTIVKLQILPEGSAPGEPEKIIDLIRDQIKLEESAAKSEIISTEKNGKKYSIGVIDIPSFYRDYKALKNGDDEFTSTTTDAKRLLDELKKENINGLIIDLRNNGGGHLTEATALSGLFIDNGPIVQLRNANGRISRLDDPDPVPRSSYNGPLIVLVNRYSASASEIFAAAIQDYNRGIVVGQQTYGKGTVQNLYVLDKYVRKKNEEELGQLTLTIGKYYRVTGESTQNKGVLPDINLPSYIDPKKSGESARKASLPWDTIRSSKFKQNESLSNLIPILTDQHRERKNTDPNMIFLVEDIKESEKNRSRTILSLNLEKRVDEREKNQKRKEQREEIRGSSVSKDKNDDRDVNLNEAAAIATDLALLMNIGFTDEQIANRVKSTSISLIKQPDNPYQEYVQAIY